MNDGDTEIILQTETFIFHSGGARIPAGTNLKAAKIILEYTITQDIEI
jgi:hypothetical protein